MKKVRIYLLLLAFTAAQYSCKKELNALPDQAKVDGNVVVDQKSAEVALNGAYYRFASGGQWAFNHEIMPGLAAGYVRYRFGALQMADNNLTSTGLEAPLIWSDSYLLINAANGVIKAVSALPDSKFSGSRKKEILAEAHFLRAYGHYKLLSYYGQYYDANSKYGALLRKEFVTLDNSAQPRSGVKESYDFILADIDDAIANAPAQNKSYYASGWVAKALKARILMNRGMTGDYTQVIALTQDIILNGPYVLEASSQILFSQKGLDSKEVMLGVAPLLNQVIKANTYFSAFSGSPQYIPTNALVTLLQGDPRSNWMIGTVQGIVGITKYTGTQKEVSYAFRLTEMYLLQAEALVRSGGDMDLAKTLLKTVMQSAGIIDFSSVDNANTTDELLMEIYKETVKNLLCEDGQDWFALLRFPLATVTSIRLTIIKKDQFVFPIPRTEFERNSAIGDQNPGYDK